MFVKENFHPIKIYQDISQAFRKEKMQIMSKKFFIDGKFNKAYKENS